MKYFEAKFTISPYSADASDLVAALAGEAGFETFEETPTGLLGYVQQQLYSEEALQASLADFPMEGVTINYDIQEAENRDWNEAWEQEGFEPIQVEGDLVEGGSWKEEENMFTRILIHDGRHLPTDLSHSHLPLSTIAIKIDAKLAFGTGTHETTRMICSTLLEQIPLILSQAANREPQTSNLRVLDCGTGTGILSICALKLGAASAVGFDIDEWSVDNAHHNAVINGVDECFTPLLGDASLLNKVEGTFGLVMANINRNILLNDLPMFRQKMAPGAILILSGFYVADCQILIEKASSLGLTLQQQKEDKDWACLVFKFVAIKK